MFLKHLLLLVLSISCSGSFNVVYAQNGDEQEILRMLQNSQVAAKKQSYFGSFVSQSGNQIRKSQIAHGFDGDVEVEKLEIVDGQAREYFRRNREVSCYLPDSKVIQVENLSSEEFPALINENYRTLPENYIIKKLHMSKVAGTECQVLSFTPKDGLRFGYRLCLEKKSGLLLGVQTLNALNEVTEQIAFTQISIGEVDKARLKPSYQNTSQWRTLKLTLPSAGDSGWMVKSLPAGFKKTLETRRLIPISGSASGNDANSTKSQQVIQMMFSDGLSTISVFVEPISGNRTEGSLQQGAMTVMAKRLGDNWLTVVGEVPSAAINQVINSVQLKK